MFHDMKIRLAKYLWVNLYFCLCISIVYYVYIGNLFMNEQFHNADESLVLKTGMLMFGALPVLCFLVPHWRGFTILKIQAESVHSYLFGLRKCTIDTNNQVYYTIFEANIEKLRGGTGKYIVISNEPFVYKDSPTPEFWSFKKHSVFIEHYDMSKQIILPYTERTKDLISVEKWINCNP